MDNDKLVKLATDLGHARVFDENSEILNNDENNMYVLDDNQECETYTEEMQIKFDYWYDYYYNKIIIIFNNAGHDI
jgi:hypothetical protein